MSLDAKVMDKVDTSIDLFWHTINCAQLYKGEFHLLPKVMKSLLSLKCFELHPPTKLLLSKMYSV